MIFDSRQVLQVNSSRKKFISIANGTATPVSGEGSLTLTDTLNLDSVVIVPSLEYNLLSVSQITTTLSCIVIFWPNSCEIKDIKSKKTIDCGIRRGKLYYLDLDSQSTKRLQHAFTIGGAEGDKQKAEI